MGKIRVRSPLEDGVVAIPVESKKTWWRINLEAFCYTAKMDGTVKSWKMD